MAKMAIRERAFEIGPLQSGSARRILNPAAARSILILVIGVQRNKLVVSDSAKLKPLRQGDLHAVRGVPESSRFISDRVDGQLIDVVEVGGTPITLGEIVTPSLWSHSPRPRPHRLDNNLSRTAMIPLIGTLPTHYEANDR